MPTATANLQVLQDVAVLREKSTRQEKDFRRLEERFEEAIEELHSEIAVLKEDKARMEKMAARWKGGAAMLIALGSLAGTVMSQFEAIKTFLRIG